LRFCPRIISAHSMRHPGEAMHSLAKKLLSAAFVSIFSSFPMSPRRMRAPIS
jgi:hypothetical protein